MSSQTEEQEWNELAIRRPHFWCQLGFWDITPQSVSFVDRLVAAAQLQFLAKVGETLSPDQTSELKRLLVVGKDEEAAALCASSLSGESMRRRGILAKVGVESMLLLALWPRDASDPSWMSVVGVLAQTRALFGAKAALQDEILPSDRQLFGPLIGRGYENLLSTERFCLRLAIESVALDRVKRERTGEMDEWIVSTVWNCEKSAASAADFGSSLTKELRPRLSQYQSQFEECFRQECQAIVEGIAAPPVLGESKDVVAARNLFSALSGNEIPR